MQLAFPQSSFAARYRINDRIASGLLCLISSRIGKYPGQVGQIAAPHGRALDLAAVQIESADELSGVHAQIGLISEPIRAKECGRSAPSPAWRHLPRAVGEA